MKRRNFLLATGTSMGFLNSGMISRSAIAATFSFTELEPVTIPEVELDEFNITFEKFIISSTNLNLKKNIKISIFAGWSKDELDEIYSDYISIESNKEDIKSKLNNINFLNSKYINSSFPVDYGVGSERNIYVEIQINHDDVNEKSVTDSISIKVENFTGELNGVLIDDWEDSTFNTDRSSFSDIEFTGVNDENSSFTVTKRPRWTIATGDTVSATEGELVVGGTSEESVIYADFGSQITPRKWIWTVDMDSQCSSGSQDLTLLANSTDTTGNGRLKESIFARFNCGSSGKETVDLRSISGGSNPDFISGTYDNTASEHVLVAEFDGIDTWELTVDGEYIGSGTPTHNITEGRYAAIGHNTGSTFRTKELQIL